MVGILRELSGEGVSLWLDGLGRDRLADGGLTRLVRDRCVVGATGALGDGDAYREQLAALAAGGATAAIALRELTVSDLRWACEVLEPVYLRTAGLDGLVSARIDPSFIEGTCLTLAEARSLHLAVDRPNLLMEIPATPEALPAITRCLGEGIGVHVSLVLTEERYRQVLEAFLAGLELAVANGLDVSRINSVAGLPVGLLDTVLDHELDLIGTPEARAFRGQGGIALARLAYRRYERALGSARWTGLAARGARPQRLLWDATEVMDRRYRDTRYAEELVAANSVTLLSEQTLTALADHGRPASADRFAGGYADAEQVLGYLDRFGVDLPKLLAAAECEALADLRRARVELLERVQARLAEFGTAP
ncbi:transaldolase [Kitasatospora gansuensis]|uniref:Transaldolase n=1 Tax=Kitasatospora gansuensis TaxID=258050 RepID=A0A7W7SDV6_9ACTN|nr:transaldolase family protein [Kitasatospora gansuensis]MBB4948113.1 transaldolase [Kitasatospora gansuensis]